MPDNSSIEEEFLKRLTELTEANLTNEQFGVSELAREMNMSRSNLHRKVVAITKTSVSQFIRQYRLKRAMEMLQQTALTISEVAYNVGFGSVTYFTKSFHDYYGFPPGEVGKRNLTESISNEQAIDANQVKSSKRFRIVILLISLLGIIIATGPFIVFKPSSLGKNRLEKTIAVLPFVNYSPEEGTTYIINGLQEEILDKLEKINELKVKSRTAVDKYKDTKLSISQIAKELRVNYIVEGSGQKVEDKIRIRLQLIETTSGNHLWAKPYEEEVNNNTIFEIQEEVALSVANELKAVITPEDKAAVIKKPTQNPAAYNNYLRGLDYLNIFNSKSSKISEISEVFKAKQCFVQATKLDSTFSGAYFQLGHIYIDLLYNTTMDRSIQRLYLDSGMMMIKKVFLYDRNSSIAFKLRGSYYYRTGMVKKANEDFDKAFELSPKNNYGLLYMRFWQFWETEDYVNALNYFYQGKELQPKEILTLPALLVNVSECFAALGYPEISRKYLDEYLKQTNDSLIYFYIIAAIERSSGNFKNALIYDLKCYEIDTSKTESLYNLMRDQVLCRDYNGAYKYLLEIEHEYSKTGRVFRVDDIFSGYIYLKNGEPKKANYCLKGLAKDLLKDIESKGIDAQQFYSYWHLSKIYTVMGEKRKALDNLKMLKKRKTNYVWLVTNLKYYPFFDFISDEPEFVDVLKDVEAKYQKVHKRAGKLMKEYGDLE